MLNDDQVLGRIISAAVEQHRRDVGLLARQAGVDRTTLWRIVKRGAPASWPTFVRVMAALNWNPMRLLSDEARELLVQSEEVMVRD